MLDDYSLKLMKAAKLTPENAPAICEAADEIASRLGIKTPNFHLIPRVGHAHPLISAVAKTPNAASMSAKSVIMTEPLIRLYAKEATNAFDFTKPISEELKAVMAHEMHHCANRASFMMMAKVPILAVPAAALTGVFLYDRAMLKAKKQNDVSPENMAKNIESEAADAKQSLPAELKKSSFLGDVLYYGKYLAVAVAATGAGFAIARHGSRFHEFAADSFAAGAVNKEAMIGALRKLHETAGASVSGHPQAKSFTQKIFSTLFEHHPSFAERVANINR